MAIIFTLRLTMHLFGRTKKIYDKFSFVRDFQTTRQQCRSLQHVRFSGWVLSLTTLACRCKHVPIVLPLLTRAYSKQCFLCTGRQIMCTSQANRRHIIKAHPSACVIDRIVTGRLACNVALRWSLHICRNRESTYF